MAFPIIIVPPCEELAIVVMELSNRHMAGDLTNMPRSYRNDLDELRRLCKHPDAHIADLLAALERLPVDELS